MKKRGETLYFELKEEYCNLRVECDHGCPFRGVCEPSYDWAARDKFIFTLFKNIDTKYPTWFVGYSFANIRRTYGSFEYITMP